MVGGRAASCACRQAVLRVCMPFPKGGAGWRHRDEECLFHRNVRYLFHISALLSTVLSPIFEMINAVDVHQDQPAISG